MISFVRLIILVFFRLTKMQPKSDGEHEIIDSTSLSCVISHANFQFWKIRRFHSISEPMSISALLTPNNTNVVIISSSNCRLRSGPRRWTVRRIYHTQIINMYLNLTKILQHCKFLPILYNHPENLSHFRCTNFTLKFSTHKPKSFFLSNKTPWILKSTSAHTAELSHLKLLKSRSSNSIKNHQHFQFWPQNFKLLSHHHFSSPLFPSVLLLNPSPILFYFGWNIATTSF